MLNNRKLILDRYCSWHYEEFDFFEDADFIFDDIQDIPVDPDAIYIIGFDQFVLHAEYICNLIKNQSINVIFFNPSEGSRNMAWMYEKYNFKELIEQHKFVVVVGGDQPTDMPGLIVEYFLPLVLNYPENIVEIEKSNQIYLKTDKPYKFLFLNGRVRPHRKYLINHFIQTELIEQSLWTNLDPKVSTYFPLIDSSPRGSFSIPVKFLPVEYEVEKFQEQLTKPFAPDDIQTNKSHLFKHNWGDIYLNVKPYADTYFSLVTETMFEYPYSFRTEKLWKPVAIGHPFIVASNAGYYRDLRNLGFKTFGHLIDESFDSIDDNQARINRIISVVEDLCEQDLPAFLAAAEETCKYNQQHLAEIAPTIIPDFTHKLVNHINERFRI